MTEVSFLTNLGEKRARDLTLAAFRVQFWPTKDSLLLAIEVTFVSLGVQRRMKVLLAMLMAEHPVNHALDTVFKTLREETIGRICGAIRDTLRAK
jgi:hypothetical protein